MEGPGPATSAAAEAQEPLSPRSEARQTASRLSILEALARQQSALVESLIRSVAPPRESPGGADRYADADATALAEVASVDPSFEKLSKMIDPLNPRFWLVSLVVNW